MGKERQSAKPITKLPSKAKRWALIIGVDVYTKGVIANLVGASNDAEALARTLTQYAGFPEDQIVLLTSNQPEVKKPDRNNILEALRNLRDQVPEDGLLLVAFACHGVEPKGRQYLLQGRHYLLPSDAKSMDDMAALEDSAIPVELVKQRIAETRVRQVIFILDTCRNDPRTARGDGDNLMPAGLPRSFNFNLRNSGVEAYATLYAASVGQRAYEFIEKQQGYFMWALVEGLKGAAANERGEVTVQSLADYVKCRVPKLVLRDHGASARQMPWVVVAGGWELVISSVERPAPRFATTDECVNPPHTVDEAAATAPYSPSEAVKLTAREKSLEVPPGQAARFSFVLTNAGENDEQFRLETTLPADYQPNFSAGQSTSEGRPIFVTPRLKRGESLTAMLDVRVPETSAGGQQHRFFVTAALPSSPEDLAVAAGTLKVKAKAAPAPAVVAGGNGGTVTPGKVESVARATPTPQPKGYPVEPVPDLQLALGRAALAAQPGQTIQLPLTVTNTGNREDQFRLETDLPAVYQPSFSQGGRDTGLPVLVTPQIQRGQTLEVILNARVPENAPDNQQQRFLVRAASQADASVMKVTDVSLIVVAAALAVSSNALQETVQPGDTFTQRISVRNQGSATARATRADFFFNPDFELVSATPSPISYDRPSRTAIWSLGDLESRDNREINVTLRALPEALAGSNKPVGRGTMRTQSLFIPSSFEGPAISVGRVAGARVEAVSKGLTATPGDTMYVPFIVRNPSNYPESFELRIVAPGAPQATVYADTNGDGLHQPGEPAVTQTSVLNPRGGKYQVLLGVDIPRSTADRTQYAYNLVTRAMNAAGRIASEDSTVLTVAAPRVRVRFELISSARGPFDKSLSPLFMKPVSWRQEDAPSQAEQETFTRGRELFAKGQYEQAAKVFSDFIKGHPGSFINDLMLLWLGRSYIELGKFTEATQVGQRLIQIKDTPFSEIYDTELQAAKAEAASRKAAPQPSPTLGARNSGTPELTVRGRGETTQVGPRATPADPGVRGDALSGASLIGPVVPDKTVYYRLVLVNDGGGIAKNLILTEQLPDVVSFVSSSPALSVQEFPGGGFGFVWRLDELGPGATAVLQVGVRFRSGEAVKSPNDGVAKARHTLTYQDLNSNAYRGQ